MEYDRSIIPADIPSRSSSLSFYDVMIHGRPYASKFDIYKTIKVMAANQSTRGQAMQMLQKTTLIHDNFIKFDLFLASLTAFTMITNPKMSTTDLFSSLGGTLNLYSGITFVVIIELVELLYLLVFHCSQKQNQSQVHVLNVQPQNEKPDAWQTKYNMQTSDIHR